MMQVIITPCLLGFDVKTRHGNGFIRAQGIFSASELINMLWHTEEPFTIVLR